MEISFFSSDVESFITSLNKVNYAKVVRLLDLLEEFGHSLSMPHSRMVRRGIFELRVLGDSSVRVLYSFVGGKAVILHSFIKKTNKIPKREMEVAERRMTSLT